MAATIVHIIEATFAGVGRHVLDLAAEQTQDGHEVHVFFSPTRESDSFARERAELSDVQWHEIQMTRSLGTEDVASLKSVRKLLNEIRPDVVHGHSTKGGILARLGRSKGSSVVYTPNAIYSMNPSLSWPNRAVVGVVEFMLARITDVIVAVSPEESDHMVKSLRFPAHKVHVIPNGIAEVSLPDRETVRSDFDIPSDQVIVGFVGRFDQQKAPDRLAEVIAGVLADSDLQTHFVVVGDGPLHNEFEAKLSALNVPLERVSILGVQPGRLLMRAFDILILPSRYEGFPYVLLEAAWEGLRIVTTDRANASLLIDEQAVDGEILNHTDVAGMVGAVKRAVISTASVGQMHSIERPKGFPEDSPFRVSSMSADLSKALGVDAR